LWTFAQLFNQIPQTDVVEVFRLQAVEGRQRVPGPAERATPGRKLSAGPVAQLRQPGHVICDEGLVGQPEQRPLGPHCQRLNQEVHRDRVLNSGRPENTISEGVKVYLVAVEQ
jgi:hypothetical protein